MAEEKLVAQIQAGDHSAYRALYLQYAATVHRYIRARVGNREEAEDLTAEVFIKAWKGFVNYQWQGSPVGAWLIRIAHNVIVDYYRKQVVPIEWLTEQVSDDRRPYATIEHRDELDRVLTGLTPEQQTILHLHFNEGYQASEIASVLNKSANAIRVAQHRALKQLRNKQS